jgi:hypothetical protein
VILDDVRTQLRAHTVLTSADLSDAQLNEFIWTTIERLQQTADWHYQENTLQIPVTGNSYTGVPLPSDFVVEAAVYQFVPASTVQPPSLIPVQRLTSRVDWAVQSTRQDRNESFPVPPPEGLSYYIWMGQLWIVPTQSNDITIQLDYFSDPTNPSQTTDQTGLLGVSPRTVLWGALQLTYLYLHEVELAAAVGEIYNQLLDAAFKREQGRRMGAKQYTRTR